MIEVSVVIATYHREDYLKRCLLALSRQNFPADSFEIVVCDDAASETTERLIAGMKSEMRPALRYFPVVCEPHGPAAARNLGISQAEGRLVAFTDDDCIPEPDWLREGIKPFEDSAVMAVMGRTVIPIPEEPTDYEKDASGLQSAEFVTANCFYRRAVLELVGGFDERFKKAWREDADLYLTLLEKNAKVARADHAVVIHPVRHARWGISISQQQKAFYNALLFKKHSRFYYPRIQPRPPWLYYGIVTAAILGISGLLRDQPVLAVNAFALWGIGTLVFLLRRLHGTSRELHHILEMVVTSLVIPPLAVYWRLAGAVKFRSLFI